MRAASFFDVRQQIKQGDPSYANKEANLDGLVIIIPAAIMSNSQLKSLPIMSWGEISYSNCEIPRTAY